MLASFSELAARNRAIVILGAAALVVLITLFIVVVFASMPTANARIESDKTAMLDASDTSYDVAVEESSMAFALPGTQFSESGDLDAIEVYPVSATLRLSLSDDGKGKLVENGATLTILDGTGAPVSALTLTSFEVDPGDASRATATFNGEIAADRLPGATSASFSSPGLVSVSDTRKMAEDLAVSKGALEGDKAAVRAQLEENERLAAEAASVGAHNIPVRKHEGGDYSDTLMVGDSIMVATSWSLYDYLPGVTIDAVSGRSLETGGPGEGGGSADGVLDHIRACDRSFSRYVIGTGNNDGAGMDVESAEEIISLLPGKQIWFVTEYVNNNSRGTANTNETIDLMCEKYPNVHKIDWYSVVSENDYAFLQGDNCHPQTSTAREAYAALVKNALDA